jgi:hypothetical protein
MNELSLIYQTLLENNSKSSRIDAMNSLIEYNDKKNEAHKTVERYRELEDNLDNALWELLNFLNTDEYRIFTDYRDTLSVEELTPELESLPDSAHEFKNTLRRRIY